MLNSNLSSFECLEIIDETMKFNVGRARPAFVGSLHPPGVSGLRSMNLMIPYTKKGKEITWNVVSD